ncbi:MAG: trypsin-like peptidase domain-containing protein, partial [Cyanobacteria bacterium P01_D01_bin.6]
MGNLWPRCLWTGVYALGTALSLSLVGSVLPAFVELPAALMRSSTAIAQDVEEQTNIDVYRRASPAVVSVEAGEGSGSGSLVTPDGLILTNAHVVGNSDTVQIRLADGREFTGDIVGFATSRADLAAIQLRGNPQNL